MKGKKGTMVGGGLDFMVHFVFQTVYSSYVSSQTRPVSWYDLLQKPNQKNTNFGVLVSFQLKVLLPE